MNDKVFKTIIGFGLLFVISLCSFLFFYDNKGCANESSVVEKIFTDQQKEALLEMFKVGLQNSQRNDFTEASESSSVKPEFYYGMIEAAIRQSSQYPELIDKFWSLFEEHLNSITVTPVARIEILDLFKQQVELCANHCKNIEEYKKIWNTSENIDKYRTQLINSEIEMGVKLFEKVDITELIKVMKRDNDAIVDLVIAYNFLTDYSSESSEELQKRFNKLVKAAGEQIISEIKNKYEGYKKSFITIKEKSQKEKIDPVKTKSGNGKIEYGVGISHQLLLDIQKFITTDLNSNILHSLIRISPNDDIIEIQTNAANLLEKTRILNQMIYNLWANRVIYNTNRSNQLDGMSEVSVEYLYPAVASIYNKKMEKILMDDKKPSLISYNINQMILKDKAPLSAF